jgi:Recombination endonuclease VII
MPRVAMQVGEPDEPKTDLARVGQQLCGKWMPRKKTTCARKPCHGGDCATAENMENRRTYRTVHPHHQSPESRKKYMRKYRISSYGLTEASFAQLLLAQEYACGMCHEPFKEGQRIHVDHDHALRDEDPMSAWDDNCASCKPGRATATKLLMRLRTLPQRAPNLHQNTRSCATRDWRHE